jgi:hypothetical protein
VFGVDILLISHLIEFVIVLAILKTLFWAAFLVWGLSRLQVES